MILTIHDWRVNHEHFLSSDDQAQSIYEHARKAASDRRFSTPESICDTIYKHGVTGIFIEPESAILSPAEWLEKSNLRNGTAYHHSHLDRKIFYMIATSLAEGVGISSTARIQAVNKKTVLLVLKKASDHTKKVSMFLMKNLSVTECQLDEMWSFIAKKEKNLESLEKVQGVLGDSWIWIAFDAVHKIFLATVAGKRTMPYAVSLIQELKKVTKCMPTLFSSDQLDQYAYALAHEYGQLVYPARKPGPGRPATKPHFVPPEDLLYVQVVKQYENNRIKKVGKRIVFGDPDKINEVLKKSNVSHCINTSYVERSNGFIRHLDARCNRKTLRFQKF